jgi:hypothetical protein
MGFFLKTFRIMPENPDQSLEKLKEWLSFVKFFLGTFLIALIAAWVDSNIKDREMELQETESIGKFIQHALTAEVGSRRRFAEYFANVSRSDEARDRWNAYLIAINKEYDSTVVKQVELSKQVEQVKEEEVKAIEKVRKRSASEPDTRKMIEVLESKYARKIDSISMLQADIKNKIEVPPIVLSAETQTLVLPEAKTVELERSVLKFLNAYPTYCFNAARIRLWGGKKADHSQLRGYSNPEIEMALQELVLKGLVVQGACRSTDLFKIADRKEK